jgi:hypothetical protein
VTLNSKFIFLFLSFCTIFLAGNVFAATTQQSLPPQKQFDTVLIWQSCDNSTYSNITSIKNGATVMLGSKVMPNIEAGYYQYSFTNTTLLGIYIVNGYCDENGVKTNWAYDFEVTREGQTINSGTYTFLIFAVLSITLLLLSFVFSNYIFAFISGLSFGVTGVYGMIYGFSTYLSTYTRMFSMIIIGLGAIITIVSGIELAQETGSGNSALDIIEEED